MTPADAGAPLTHGEGGFVPVAHRGLQWVAQQLAPSVEDDELARLQAEYRWKWFAGGDSESREDFVTDVNAELRRHLAGNMPGWCAAMTSSAKVVGLHEQVARALYGNRGDLSELKARAAFHRTQTKEQCVEWCAPPAPRGPQAEIIVIVRLDGRVGLTGVVPPATTTQLHHLNRCCRVLIQRILSRFIRWIRRINCPCSCPCLSPFFAHHS